MNKRKFLNIILLCVIILIYCVFIKIFGYGIPCVFHKIFKIKCPGCGITTMYVNIFNFNLKQAFLSNPVIFCSQPFLYYEIIKIIYYYIYDKSTKFNKIENFCLYLLIVILIIFGILRNII